MRSIRNLRTRVLTVALMLASAVVVGTSAGTPAQAAGCTNDNIRLYRAHATTGSVDTSAGNWIGADFYTGGNVYVSRNGYYRYAAAFGNQLTAGTTVYYTFYGPTTGYFTPQPYVSSNSVMKDTQRYTIANDIPNGTYEAWVEYVDPCNTVNTINRKLGNLIITD